jgi:hypothetical protein
MKINRRSSLAILALTWLMAEAQPAAAAPLAFTGTLTIRLVNYAGLDFGELAIPGSGVASVSGGPHLGSFMLSGGTFGPVTTSIAINLGTLQSQRFTAVDNRSGSFSGGAGTMGMSGLAKLCITFDPTCIYVPIPVPIGATGTPLAGFGIGGTQVQSAVVGITAQHAPWGLTPAVMTIHRALTAVTTPSIPGGFIHGPASGSASSAAQPSGVVQVVTASKVYTSMTGAFPEYSMYAVLNLHFVPEPGTLVLLGMAAVGVLAVARSRR